MKSAGKQVVFLSWLRTGCAGLVFVAVTFGCSTPVTKAPARASAPVPPQSVAPAPSEVGSEPAKIVSVNPELRFVVIDFDTSPMAPVGTRLSVYRGGKEVGAVRVTEPARAQLATADIVQGEARVGDEVR